MQLGYDEANLTLSRFVYEEKYVREDAHPRKDIFWGPKSTRDVSVDRHAIDTGIDWYAGAAVKSGMRPVASAEFSAKVIKSPLYVKPYSVPRMPCHADVAGWLDAPGWGENKERAKDLAKIAICQMNPKLSADEYIRPQMSYVVNCVGDKDVVLSKLKCLEGCDRSDIECVCYVSDSQGGVFEAICNLALRDRRVVLIKVDLANSKASFYDLFVDKSGVRGDKVVFVGCNDSLELALGIRDIDSCCHARADIIANIESMEFSDRGDVKMPDLIKGSLT